MRLLLLPGAAPRRYQVVLDESTYESAAAVPMKCTVPFASTIGGTPKLNPVGSSQTGRTPLAVASAMVAAGSAGTMDSIPATLRSRRVAMIVAVTSAYAEAATIKGSAEPATANTHAQLG